VLRYLDRGAGGDEEAAELVAECLTPAVAQMRARLATNPYASVLAAVAATLAPAAPRGEP
jgi:hypothetical protein